jgi:hypothetical protein
MRPLPLAINDRKNATNHSSSAIFIMGADYTLKTGSE